MTTGEYQRICFSGDAAGPADVSAVEQAETELAVRFPKDYADFLRTFGALIAPGVQIYGLVTGHMGDPPFWESVVEVTKKLRALGQAGTERSSFVAISDDGTGIYFFLDTSTSGIWAIGPGIERIVASSLPEFVVAYSRGRIAF